MLATGAATVPKRDNHDTRRWASSNATAGNKQHDSQSKGRRRFAPIVEWLVVFEHMASKCQVAVRQVPGGNGRIGSISTEFGIRFRVGFDLNFGHIFASH